MPAKSSHAKKLQEFKTTAKKTRNAYSNMWSTSNTCNLFRAKTQNRPDGSKPKHKYKSTVILKKHLFKTLLSGASAQCSEQLNKRATQMRVAALNNLEDDNKATPITMTMTKPAAMLLENFIIAYAQSIFRTSTVIKNTLQKHTKVTSACANSGSEVVNDRINALNAIVPTSASIYRIPAVEHSDRIIKHTKHVAELKKNARKRQSQKPEAADAKKKPDDVVVMVE
jgi:hypothetical protein